MLVHLAAAEATGMVLTANAPMAAMTITARKKD
jgi:hypothetical protein